MFFFNSRLAKYLTTIYIFIGLISGAMYIRCQALSTGFGTFFCLFFLYPTMPSSSLLASILPVATTTFAQSLYYALHVLLNAVALYLIVSLATYSRRKKKFLYSQQHNPAQQS